MNVINKVFLRSSWDHLLYQPSDLSSYYNIRLQNASQGSFFVLELVVKYLKINNLTPIF